MSARRVIAAFRDQANSCRTLGSPFTAELCDYLADALGNCENPVSKAVLGWQGDPSSGADSVPLRLAGALHALVLTGADDALGRMYQQRRIDRQLVLDALDRHGDFILNWLNSPPQTNEVARSAAIIAAARFLAGQVNLPIRALELGASAGLNLNFARYSLLDDDPDAALQLAPKWQGEIPRTPFQVVTAEGVDLRPVDPLQDRLRLMAFCWADQDQRLARLKAALDMAREHRPRVTAGDAGPWLESQLAHLEQGHVTLVYHTVAAQYFPRDTLARCEAALTRAAESTGPDRVLAHVSMERDGIGDGAALTLRLWDGRQQKWALGRADFHGRWIKWCPTPSQGLGLTARQG